MTEIDQPKNARKAALIRERDYTMERLINGRIAINWTGPDSDCPFMLAYRRCCEIDMIVRK